MILKMHRPVFRDYEWQEQLRYQRHQSSAEQVQDSSLHRCVTFRFLDAFLCRAACTWLSVGWLVEKSRCGGFYRQGNSSTRLKINNARRSASHPLLSLFFWKSSAPALNKHHRDAFSAGLSPSQRSPLSFVWCHSAKRGIATCCSDLQAGFACDQRWSRWGWLEASVNRHLFACRWLWPPLPQISCLPFLAAWISPLELPGSSLSGKSWDSEACLPRCIMAAASVHLQHLAERSCSSGGCGGSVEALWVCYSRADLLINSEEGLSIWKLFII